MERSSLRAPLLAPPSTTLDSAVEETHDTQQPRSPEALAALAGLFRAHGGRELFERVQRIDVRLTTGGLACVMRRIPHELASVSASVFPRERRTVLRDWPTPGVVATWDGGEVALDVPGVGTTQRASARAHAAANKRWDDLDLLYFVGYALWNYLSFPYLLEEAESVEVHRAGRLLAVEFPAGFPTHSRRQYFHLDGDHLLLRHDYLAEVFGGWASAANHCLRHEEVGGLRFYTRRRVTPALGRAASLPFPVLLDIELAQPSVVLA